MADKADFGNQHARTCKATNLEHPVIITEESVVKAGPKSCFDLVLEDLERCGSQSSAHGWSHGFVTGSWKKRSFWLFMTLIAFMACIYYIQARIKDFINSGVATGFSSQYPSKGGVPLPYTVFCQLNAFDDTMFYEEPLKLKETLTRAFDESTKKDPVNFHNAIKDHLWMRLTVEPTFSQTKADVHNRYFFTKLVGESIGLEELLHGVEDIECDTNDPACKDEVLKMYDDEYKPKYPTVDHLLGLLATELIFQFSADYQLATWNSLTPTFQEVMTYEDAKKLSEDGSAFRTQVDMLSWMLQLTNPKDGTIHDPDFLSETLETNKTQLNANSMVSHELFSSYMDPARSIVSVKFGGRLLNPADVFERKTLDISNNCLALKEDMAEKLKQTSSGPLGGLKLIVFTGYPGVAVETVYKSLQRKPGLAIILDHPDTGDAFPDTHSPINFRAGSLTKVGIKRSMTHRLTKEESGDEFAGCDADTRGDEMYSVEKCHQRCFIDIVQKNCNCVPHYAMHTGEFKNQGWKECGFEDLKQDNCWQNVATQKQDLGSTCTCKEPCTISKYDVSYSVTGSNIRGNMDALEASLDYENDDEKSTDFWKEKLGGAADKEEEEDFEFLERAINSIKMVGKVYAFKNGIDTSEALEDPEILANGFSVLDIFYEDLNIQVANEYLTDQETSLISDLGGQLGLWIGMSMITSLELIYCAFRCCRKRRCC